MAQDFIESTDGKICMYMYQIHETSFEVCEGRSSRLKVRKENQSQTTKNNAKCHSLQFQCIPDSARPEMYLLSLQPFSSDESHKPLMPLRMERNADSHPSLCRKHRITRSAPQLEASSSVKYESGQTFEFACDGVVQRHRCADDEPILPVLVGGAVPNRCETAELDRFRLDGETVIENEVDVGPRGDVELVRGKGRIAVEKAFGEFAICLVLGPVSLYASCIAVVL